MKTKSVLALAIVLSAATVGTLNVQAAENYGGMQDPGKDPNFTPPLFKDQELSLDLFGSYINPERQFNDLFDTSIRNGFWGGGAGVTYYFTRYTGLGTDFNISDHSGGDWKFDYWVGDLYLRFPLGQSGVCPYIYGSGGRSVNPSWTWVYGFGPGLELRFSPHLGFFTDARFLWSKESTSLNTLTFRAGVRLTF